MSRAAQRKTNAVTVFVRFQKTIKILFKRQNIFLLFLIIPNVLHSHLPASGSKLNKLDTDTIFHSKQLRRTLKFTDKYGAIEKAVAPTKRQAAMLSRAKLQMFLLSGEMLQNDAIHL